MTSTISHLWTLDVLQLRKLYVQSTVYILSSLFYNESSLKQVIKMLGSMSNTHSIGMMQLRPQCMCSVANSTVSFKMTIHIGN